MAASVLPRWTAGLAILLLSLALALPTRAEISETGRFDVDIRGFTAGTVAFSAARNDTSYASAARLQSRGIVNIVRSLRFDVEVRGRVSGGRLQPTNYREDIDTGRRESRTVMEYRDGVPVVLSVEPEREPRPYHLDPATQRGTIDPATALYELLQARPRDGLCDLMLHMFDGRRRTQISLTAPRPDGNSVQCTGEYRRVAGYSESELAERTRFPFTLVYDPAGDGLMQVGRIEIESMYGPARMVRR